MKRSEVNRAELSPMMRQYMEIKDQYDDVVLMFRLGDFYEMFFEDAEVVAHELELTLTGKNAGLKERIPMCGIPYHAVNVYLEKLVDLGHRVAICEQVTDPKEAKGIVQRQVTNVISKGTMMNSDSLNEKENNYIGNIIDFEHAYGISFSDISTGEFKVKLIAHKINDVISEILSLGIKEVIVNEGIDCNIVNILRNQYKLVVSVYNTIDEMLQYRYLYDFIDDVRMVTTVKHLLSYLEETQKRNLGHLQKVSVIEDNQYLKLDIHTIRNLELLESARLKTRNYSLLWLLDKTKTAMGSRMLKSYLEAPLIDIRKIEERQSVVGTLLEEFILKEELREILYQIYDLERLSGRIAYGNANARDLLQLKTSLKVLPSLKQILRALKYSKSIDVLDSLYQLLERSIYEEPPISIKEGFLIKEGYHKELDELKEIKSSGKDFIARMEKEERERTGIKNLKVGFNKVFGYYIEVSKGNLALIPEDFQRKQTLTTGERFITPVLKEKESMILGAEERIINLEYQLFTEVREKVKEYIPKLQEVAKIIAEIDVLQSFATVTEENGYVKPVLSEKREICILEARHPVIEKVADFEFVPNDIVMGEDTSILLITGPNMAGKSTYMRQMALVVIMAQIGCYVPCKSCTIPVFDKIFTRIVASDDLVSGESTFMVEMNEANRAISNATKNSLVLFDELGRGTATYDGMSLAQAIIEYIHDEIHCKTFFSTHYHELTSLEKELKHLKNIHVSAHEEDGKITFLHKIKEGAVDKSYGIHVASLAKLPTSLIKRAEVILNTHEKGGKTKQQEVQMQLPLDFEIKESKIEAELEKLNPLEVSPMEALNILCRWKEEIKK